MERIVGVGVLGMFEGPMAVECGRILEQELRVSLDMWSMLWGKAIIFVFWFWHDPWSGPIPLKDLYPDLFACAVSKEAWIFDLVVSNLEGGNRSWNLQFR